MPRWLGIAGIGGLLALGCAGGPPPAPAVAPPPAAERPADVSEVAAGIRDLLASPAPRVEGEPLRERDALAAFYAARGGRPMWETQAVARLEALLAAVRGAQTHGLPPARYHEAALARTLATHDDAAKLADARRQAGIELLRSDAFLHLARELSAGAVDPGRLHPGYARGDTPPDPQAALREVLEGAAPDAVLAAQAPPHPEYAALRAGLARLRAAAAAGGWPSVPSGPKLARGDRDARVPKLRARLAGRGGSGSPEWGDPERFDAALEDALRRFQDRHGLEPDGVLGPETTEALNVPVTRRIAQVGANLERWRWQPRHPGERAVRVQVPAFRLRARVDGETWRTMRVVVGSPEWPTPWVHSAITRVVLNPAWELPRSIAVRETLPRILREPGYLQAQGIRVLALEQEGWTPVDAAAVDWSALDEDHFPYRLVQPPGPSNPLGLAKFAFANAHGVFLHGTPGRGALEQPRRARSHGCVRVEDEIGLATWALAPRGGWDRERLAREVVRARAAGASRELALPEPLSVHLVYFTAEADADGALRFHPDVYGWDAPLEAALSGADPSGAVAGEARPCAAAPLSPASSP